MQGGRRKGGETAPEQELYAAFLLLPTLALSFVDSGSGAGTKFGSLAILLRSDSSFLIVIASFDNLPRIIHIMPRDVNEATAA